MEASETVQETPTTADQNGNDAAEHSPAEERTHSSLYKYSRYVHVGPGAAECPEGENGSCKNDLHFHAWCRVPNQFQHSSIREKALAAKARKLRLLRDPESDSRVILDADIEEMVHSDSRDAIIEELVQKDFLKDYLAAVAEVGEEEEWKTIEEDRERYRALGEMEEDQRPKEEYEELEKHLDKYAKATEKAYQDRQQPLRESLEARSTPELADLLRDQRIEAEASQSFNQTYLQWEQFIGTLKPKSPDKPGMPSERVFPDINQMVAAAPEVVEALELTFQELDASANRALKNS